MIVEQRDYRAVPGGAQRYLSAWYRSGRPAQVRHLGEPLGVYLTETGELNTLVYLWRYDDLADRGRRRAALVADEDFAAFRAEVRGLLVSQANRILIQVDLATSI
ncbi:NIPSNAP family protein [Flexivirga caeni]|uniref:NIPSNAP family protein n=1 Tax=Flexivirga caeni TaxID=2294115 RepID=A0A3M9MBL3_9MICO|nr:NIPSNAP family protein [Flexivirga caeni]RNI22936.1 NIPSNAP family protein [Flexivirga caeni]